MSEYDDADYPSGLYPDTEVRGEGRARRPKRPAPTIEAPHVYTLGWGVELRDPGAWVSSAGESETPYWWAKREVAERIAMRYAGLGRHAHVMHGTRRRDCTSGARNPWEPGYRASVDGPRCGQSIQWTEVPNLTAARDQKRAEKELARELAKAAKADARERRAQAAKSPSFASMPGADGEIAAITYLRKHGLEDDRSYEALRYLEDRTKDSLLTEERDLDVYQLRELTCQLASDLAHSDTPAARKLVRLMKPGTCRTTEELLARIADERRELAARIRARGGRPHGKPRRAPQKLPETLPLRPSLSQLRKLGNAQMRIEREAAKAAKAAEREAAKAAKAAEREAAKAAKAAEREAAKAARAEARARIEANRAERKRAASPEARAELARRAESESRAVIAREAKASRVARREREKDSPKRVRRAARNLV